MNKEWSEMNHTMQRQISKKDTYDEGIQTLLLLREKLFDEMLLLKNKLNREDFNAMPYMNAKGYHNKTVAYALWHIFRIEDIVAHSLILNDEQIFFTGDYKRRINSPIITTGNELIKEQIGMFSKDLKLNALYEYIAEVNRSTNELLLHLSYKELKRKIPEAQKERLQFLGVVSKDENAYWLIDYWCSKDIRGLITMPFSRHWIMHVEASLRIIEKLNKYKM
jgi:hypothetical protein